MSSVSSNSALNSSVTSHCHYSMQNVWIWPIARVWEVGGTLQNIYSTWRAIPQERECPSLRSPQMVSNVNSLITFQTPLINRDRYPNQTYFRCHFFCTILHTITMHTDIQSAMYNTTSCFNNCQFLSQHIHVNVNYVHYQTCYYIYRPDKQELSGKQLPQRGRGHTFVWL